MGTQDHAFPIISQQKHETLTMSVVEKECSQWKDLNDFSEYVQSLHSKTRFDKAALELCHSEICNAIYGTGNPDISGIGVRLNAVLSLV